MRLYLVTIGARANPRLSFEAISPDSCSCIAQHLDLVQPGEAVRVVFIRGVKR